MLWSVPRRLKNSLKKEVKVSAEWLLTSQICSFIILHFQLYHFHSAEKGATLCIRLPSVHRAELLHQKQSCYYHRQCSVYIFQRCHTVLPSGIATQAPSACCYLSVASSGRRMTHEKAASSKQQRQKAGNLHRDGSAMWQLFLAGCDYDVPRFVTTRITGPESGCSVRCWAPTFLREGVCLSKRK